MTLERRRLGCGAGPAAGLGAFVHAAPAAEKPLKKPDPNQAPLALPAGVQDVALGPLLDWARAVVPVQNPVNPDTQASRTWRWARCWTGRARSCRARS